MKKCGSFCAYYTKALATVLIIVTVVADNYEIANDGREIELDSDGRRSERLDSNTSASNYDSTCGLYVAESAIPNSGLGMFTARAIQHGERIFPGELVIQAEDPDINAHLRRLFYKRADSSDDKPWLMNNYIWGASSTLGDFESENTHSIVPGLGMLANSHTALMNVEMQFPYQTYDLHRYNDPGAGAVTTYHDLHFIPSHGDIQKGSELFVAYGDSWFEQRTELGMIPLSKDFQRADNLIRSIGDLPEIMENDGLFTKILRIISDSASTEPRFQSAIPTTLPELQRALKSGTASISVPKRIRSMKWLNKHGLCLDNIKPGVSTMKQAGQGAFATRALTQGQVVAPMPLLQLQRHHMDVYHSANYHDVTSKVRRVGKQVLLNYVYGHPKSSLLFFPYSPVVNYVNHGNASQANVELRWSSLKPNRNNEFLSKTAEEVCHDQHTGLIMELVVTKDIGAGDEIFLNYGSDWENAWNDHLANWKPNEKYKHYVSAAELNARNEDILTLDELKDLDNPLYNIGNDTPVSTVCFVQSLEQKNKDADEDEPKIYGWKYMNGMYLLGDNRHPCNIIERNSKGNDEAKLTTYYTAILQYGDEKLIVEDLPREALRFADNNYMSDMTLRTTFRHEIPLPDEMVPDSWRDL